MTDVRPLLEVEDLRVAFDTPNGRVQAVGGVSFRVPRGATVGIVGESGSGKTVTVLSILGLLRGTASTSGRVSFDGEELLAASDARLAELRGAKIAMIFQDPMASLNPSHRIGAQVTEPLAIHKGASKRERARRAVELLAEVGIPEPEHRARSYPHELSGGMRQRAMIAMALACEPALLVADEPTTALDVTIQAQIMELLAKLSRAHGMSILFITHDLGLVAEAASEVIVMYAGTVVERGPTSEVLVRPRHPYTAGLLASTPLPGARAARLTEIPGVVPDLRALPPGCPFADRCPRRADSCEVSPPPLVIEGGRAHRCLFPLEPGGEP